MPAPVLSRWSGKLYFQRGLDDVRRLVQPIDSPDGVLEPARGGTVVRPGQDGFDCRAQPHRGEFTPGDHDACSLRGDAGGDSRLVVAQRYAHQRHTFGQGFKRGIETGVRDDGRCPLHDIELRSVAHDERITGQCAE